MTMMLLCPGDARVSGPVKVPIDRRVPSHRQHNRVRAPAIVPPIGIDRPAKNRLGVATLALVVVAAVARTHERKKPRLSLLPLPTYWELKEDERRNDPRGASNHADRSENYCHRVVRSGTCGTIGTLGGQTHRLFGGALCAPSRAVAARTMMASSQIRDSSRRVLL